jgi:hypothetical protein
VSTKWEESCEKEEDDGFTFDYAALSMNAMAWGHTDSDCDCSGKTTATELLSLVQAMESCKVIPQPKNQRNLRLSNLTMLLV